MKKNISLITIICFLCFYNQALSLPAATILVAQPQGGGTSLSSGCTGQTIRLLGTNFVPPDFINNKIVINGISQLTYFYLTGNIIEFTIPTTTPSGASGIVFTDLSGNSNSYSFTVNKSPSSSDAYTAGNPNIYNQCQTSTFTMTANTPLVGTGHWSCVSGCLTASITNPSSPVTTVTNVAAEVPLLLNWTISNAGCVDSVSLVTLYNFSLPTSLPVITSALSQDLCITSPVATLVAISPLGLFTDVGWNQVSGPASGILSNPTSFYTPFNTTISGVYKYQYAINNGLCSNLSPIVTITVYDQPIVSAGPDISQCYGVPSNLNGSVSNSTMQNWSLSGGQQGSLNSTVIVNPVYTSAGTDAAGVNFTATLSGSNPGCGNMTDNAYVMVHPKPIAQITAGSTINICAGSPASIPITFTGTAPFSGLGLFDGTTNNNLGTISGSSYVATLSPSSSVNYTLLPIVNFKDNNNCIGTWSGSRNVVVTQNATATISVVPSTVCAGSTASLQFTATGGGGPGWTVYYNSGGSNTNMTISGSTSLPVTPSSSTAYTIDSIMTPSCGKIPLTGITTLLTVNPPPVVSSLTISVSDDTLCSGESTLITINNVQANTIYKLIKNFNNNNLDSVSVASTSPGNITLTIPYSKFTPGTIDTLKFNARRAGCVPVFSSQRKSIWASNLNTPVVTVSPVQASCNKYILQSAAMQPGIFYQWYENSNILVGNTIQTTTAYIPGAYVLKAADSLLCRTSSNTILINYDADIPQVNVNEISSAETKLTAVNAAQHYRWYAQTNSGIKKIQGDSSNSLSVYFDGTYYLGAYTNNCFFMSAGYTVSNKIGGSLLRQSFAETDSTLVLPEIDFSTDAKVYPNPVSQADFTIDYIAEDVTKVTFMLYNPQGLAIAKKEVDGNGIIRTTLSSKDLPTGIYNLIIYDGVKQIRKNIMIY